MKLPSRIIDLSSPLENETVYDPPFMRPKIAYRINADTAPLLCELFPGLRREDLPDGEGWAIEEIQLTTHNGSHMDAPIHFQSKSIDGKPMMTIDQVPLDWFFRPGVKLDFRKVPDGHVVTAAEVDAELKRIGHELKPFDIVLVNTRASRCIGSDEWIALYKRVVCMDCRHRRDAVPRTAMSGNDEWNERKERKERKKMSEAKQTQWSYSAVASATAAPLNGEAPIYRRSTAVLAPRSLSSQGNSASGQASWDVAGHVLRIL
jgi:kynurenine formamidase